MEKLGYTANAIGRLSICFYDTTAYPIDYAGPNGLRKLGKTHEKY